MANVLIDIENPNLEAAVIERLRNVGHVISDSGPEVDPRPIKFINAPVNAPNIAK